MKGDMVHILLEKATEFIVAYCKDRRVGANGVVIAEPLAGLLSPSLAEEFSGPYVKQIVDAVQDDDFLVIYHNCGNSTIQTIESIWIPVQRPIILEMPSIWRKCSSIFHRTRSPWAMWIPPENSATERRNPFGRQPSASWGHVANIPTLSYPPAVTFRPCPSGRTLTPLLRAVNEFYQA